VGDSENTTGSSPTGGPLSRTDQRSRRHRSPHHNVPQASESFVGWVDLGPKGGRAVYRSGYERDALLLLRMDRAVRLIERNDLSALERLDFDARSSTPNRVFVLPGGGEYTPDLRVTLEDGSIVYVEVGPNAKKTEPAEAAKLEAARVEATRAGATLVVMTDRNTRGFRLGERAAAVRFAPRAGVSGRAGGPRARDPFGQRSFHRR
jgi:hypothetical protein